MANRLGGTRTGDRPRQLLTSPPLNRVRPGPELPVLQHSFRAICLSHVPRQAPRPAPVCPSRLLSPRAPSLLRASLTGPSCSHLPPLPSAGAWT